MLNIIEQKLGIPFLGKTGNDLLEYINENAYLIMNGDLKLEDLLNEPYESPEKFQIITSPRGAYVIEEILTIEKFITSDGYSVSKASEAIEYDDPEIVAEAYISNQNGKSLLDIIDDIRDSLIKIEDDATIIFKDPFGNEDLAIYIDHESVSYRGKTQIITNNDDLFIQSLLFLAIRCGKENLSFYLSKFEENHIEYNE